MDFKYKRAPASLRKIKDIDPIKDIRARLLGKICEKNNGVIVLEDSTGRIEITIDERTSESIRIGESLRVFCRVMQLENGFELRAELIQDMNNLDRELYEKVFFS